MGCYDGDTDVVTKSVIFFVDLCFIIGGWGLWSRIADGILGVGWQLGSLESDSV